MRIRKLTAARAARALAGVAALLLALATTVPATAIADEPGNGTVRIHLLWTNDLHGHIAPEGARFMNPEFPPPLGGAASAAGYIERIRAEAEKKGEGVLLVDVGDFFQGTPVGTKTGGEAVVDYFNTVGYDLVVPGNHDFDLGRETTERLARETECPWLCANIVEKETGEVPDWLRPTLMLEREGLRIGVVGLITPTTEQMSLEANVRGLEFLPMAETLRRYRDELRAEGAQIIFLAIHEGLPRDPEEGYRRIVESEGDDIRRAGGSIGTYARYGGEDLMRLLDEVSGVDFAVGGHTHQGYEEPWIDPKHHTMAFETYGNGSSLGHAILEFDRATATLVGWEAPHDRGTIVTLFEDELWPEPEMTEELRPWIEKTEAELDQVVGRTTGPLPRGDAGSNLVGNLVTDAMRERLDGDFAIQNLGGLRSDLQAGDITARDVFSVLPFGNQLILARVPGSLLLEIVEAKLAGDGSGLVISGGQVAFDGDRPSGQKVVSFTVGGEPLDVDRQYDLVATNYLMEGNSGLEILTTIPDADKTPTQITTAEAVEAYLRDHSPVTIKVDDRWLERSEPRAPYLP